jgi:hypothetical protein
MLRGLCWCLFVWLGCARAGLKPDFSGTWKLNLTTSRLEIPLPDSSVFYIEHKEPLFRLKRTHVFHGRPNTWGIELTTDGKEVIQKEGNEEFHVRLLWDGDALIFDSYWLAGTSKTANVVRYTLSPDGKVFTADERLTGATVKHHNIWVFDRQ